MKQITVPDRAPTTTASVWPESAMPPRNKLSETESNMLQFDLYCYIQYQFSKLYLKLSKFLYILEPWFTICWFHVYFHYLKQKNWNCLSIYVVINILFFYCEWFHNQKHCWSGLLGVYNQASIYLSVQYTHSFKQVTSSKVHYFNQF